MTAPEFTTAEEFRFLAAQCDAQARSTHRAEDQAFIRLLAANLFQIGGHGSIDLIAGLIGEAIQPAQPLTDLLFDTAHALRRAAERLEHAEAVA